MDINTIIIILVVVGIIYFATRALGKTIKLAISIMLSVIVVLALLTVLVYKDMESLKNSFQNGNNAFMLYENYQLYTGIILKPLDNFTLSLDSFDYFTEEEISRAQEALDNKDYKGLLENNKRVFIFKPIVINIPFSLSLTPEIKIEQGDLLNIVMSNDPYLALAKKISGDDEAKVELTKASLKELYGDSQKFKGYLFAAMLSNYFVHQNPGELVKNIKNKNIIVYPETISFKIIRYLPWA